MAGSAAAALRTAADRARDAARAVQVETRVGQKLLQFAHNAWGGLCTDVARATADSVPGYDQNARQRETAGRTGTLVDGRL